MLALHVRCRTPLTSTVSAPQNTGLGRDSVEVLSEEIIPFAKGRIQVRATLMQRQGEPPMVVLDSPQASAGLVLHWGVHLRGKGGWSLLPEYLWPEGTWNHKHRAMSSPFPSTGHPLCLYFTEDVQSVSFTVKDTQNNYFKPARGDDVTLSLPGQGAPAPRHSSVPAPAPPAPAPGPDLQYLPEDMVQCQAYILWEKAGRPEMSEERASDKYQRAAQSLVDLLEAGSTLEQLREDMGLPPLEDSAAVQVSIRDGMGARGTLVP